MNVSRGSLQADIWDAIEGIRAGGNVHVLEMGNPVIPSGHFYDSFGRDQSIYKRISISAFDTPNFQTPDGRTITEEELMAITPEELAYRPFPSLLTREWVRERLKVWAETSEVHRTRTRGVPLR